MAIVPASSDNIVKAAALLRGGELVAFPTETVYGLGADALNADAVAKIFTAKRRPAHNPLIVHLASFDRLSTVVNIGRMTPRQRELLHTLAGFWPGPLSLVLPAGVNLPRVVTGGQDTVAVRIPAHGVALELLKICGFPIAAPSANPSSYVSPTTAAHVEEGLGSAVALVLDGGPCVHGIESTIVSLMHEPPLLLRAGSIPLEALAARIGPLEQPGRAAPAQTPLAPGMLREHYAPRTAVVLRGTLPPSRFPQKVGLISFESQPQTTREFDYSAVTELSKSRDLREVGAKLFAALRDMDKRGLELIVVDTCEEQGLGLAIMDRLVRAAARTQNG